MELSRAQLVQWRRLRAQLELAEGFWLGFVFVDHPAVAAALRDRAGTFLDGEGKTHEVRRYVTPEALTTSLLTDVFSAGPAVTGCMFLESIAVDSQAGGPWYSAWQAVLLRCNERRDALRRALSTGLVFMLPREFKRLVRDAAPDLWSVRSLVIEIQPESVPEAALPHRQFRRDLSPLEAAPAAPQDPELTERRAARVRDPAARGVALHHAAEAYLRLGRLDEALRTATHAVHLLEGSEDPARLRERLEAQLTLGRILRLKGEVDLSFVHTASAVRGLETVSTSAQRSEALGELGLLLRDRGDLAAAAAAFREQTAILEEQSMPQRAGLGQQVPLSLAYARLGDTLRELGDLDGAHQSIALGLEIAQRLYREAPAELEVQRALSILYDRLGATQLDAGDASAALSSLGSALELMQRISAREPSNRYLRLDLAMAYARQGWALFRVRDLPAARKSFERALDAITLAGPLDSDRSSWVRASLQVQLGLIAESLADLEQAREHLASALELAEAASARGDDAALDQLASTARELGEFELRQKNYARARPPLQQSEQAMSRLVAKHPENEAHRRELAKVTDRLGSALLGLGQLEEAQRAIRGAIDLHRKGGTSDAKSLGDLASFHEHLGQLDQEAEDLDNALAHFQSALELREQLARQGADHPRALRDLSHCLGRLGALHQARGDLTAAERFLQRAIEMGEGLLSDAPEDVALQLFLAESTFRLATILRGSGELDRSQQLSARAAELVAPMRR